MRWFVARQPPTTPGLLYIGLYEAGEDKKGIHVFADGREKEYPNAIQAEHYVLQYPNRPELPGDPREVIVFFGEIERVEADMGREEDPACPLVTSSTG